jgi:hypothetical protein
MKNSTSSLVLIVSLLLSTTAFGAKTSKAVQVEKPTLRIFKPEKKSLEQFKPDINYTFDLGDNSFVSGAALIDLAKDQTEINGIENPKGPVLWLHNSAEKLVVDFREVYPNWFIRHVFYNQQKKWAFLFLEWRTAGPEMSFKILKTTDAGKTWTAAAPLKKPPFTFPTAELNDFYLNEKGHGIAVFTEYTSDDSNNSLVYHVKTSDFGQSWKYDKKPVIKNVLSQARQQKQ